MRRPSASFAVWGLVALSFVSAASGQDRRGRVFRTEIYNGTSRTVSYAATGLSPSDAQSLRELARLENEASYLRDVESLKREYVASERLLEAQRRSAQQALLAADMTGMNFGFAPTVGFGFGNSLAFGGYAPYTSFPAAYAPGGYGFGNTYPGMIAMARPALGAYADEGVMKASMARAIAQQAVSSDSAQSAQQAYERAVARASASPALRTALNLPERDGSVRAVANEEESPVTLTLKNGDKVRGVKVEEKTGWFYVTLPGKRQLRIRESDVIRVETAPGGVSPAGGD